MGQFSTILKQPSAQGVHQTTAIGNADRDRKRRSFNEVVAQQSVSTKRPDYEKPNIDEEDTAEQDIVRGVKPNAKAWQLPLDVRKTDPTMRLVFGWASVAALDGERIIDKQGDIIPVDELEKAVVEYSLNSREGGDMHSRKGVSKLIESFVFTPEKEALGIVAKDDQGRTIHGWWTGFYVHDDELWAAYKRGERPELSIGGQAFPVEVEVGKKKDLGDEVEKAKADLDKYREKTRKLVEKATANRTHHVLEIADRSRDGRVVYIDEHVPRRVCGVDTNVSLAWHELSEWLAMNDGMSYDEAHEKVATPLEQEIVGDKWDRYQAEFDQYEHEIEDIDEADVPSDIDLRVYTGKELAFMRRAVEKRNKPILCLDFDGVIHNYSGEWKGADGIPDPPVEGAMQFLWEATEHFKVNIFSSRSYKHEGVVAMRKWLTRYFRDYCAAEDLATCDVKLAEIEFPDRKPVAMVAIDDRALTFDGTWPSIDSLKQFKPWNK